MDQKIAPLLEELRADMQAIRQELQQDMQGLRQESGADTQGLGLAGRHALRQELRGEMKSLRDEMNVGFGKTRNENKSISSSRSNSHVRTSSSQISGVLSRHEQYFRDFDNRVARLREKNA